MPFLRVYTLMDLVPPGRLYNHSGGNEVFSGKINSLDYFLEQGKLINNQGLDYFLAISWGEGGRKMLDIFGYSGVKENWKANPGVKNWVIRNGVLVPKSDITCGEGLILLGKEEEHRLKTKSLMEYLHKNLDLEKINQIIKRE